MNINLNDSVKVILTKEGADILNAMNAEFYRRVRTIKPHLYCEGEEYKTQLWCLFEEFGNVISISSTRLPFKNNEIITV